MIEPRKGDNPIVAHARRELEMAGLFTPSENGDYDGFIGKGSLALIKLFDQWTQDDPSKMQVLQNMFQYLIVGDLLSPPTNDPDEWEDVQVEGQTVTRNRRNNMYITRDGKKTWFNLRTQQKGICNDIKTGKPLEGVRDPNGSTKVTKDKESSADAGNAGDGANTSGTAEGEASAKDADTSTGADTGPVEEGKLDAGVEQKSAEAPSEKKAAKKKPQSGEK